MLRIAKVIGKEKNNAVISVPACGTDKGFSGTQDFKFSTHHQHSELIQLVLS